MYVFAYIMQAVALLAALGASAAALLELWSGKARPVRTVPLVEHAHWAVTGALWLASALLLHALFWHDYRLTYVASYTDNILDVFYCLTAFWAGQPGSMLFWALAVAASGSLFAFTEAYKKLTPATRLWYWAFFHAIMAFFALVLTSYSNPFVMQDPAPADGSGLNPLLQNPGMIFHPPLLFMGYGGFAVPSCLALAQCLNRDACGEDAWFRATRPFLILAWIFLTAGIVLGAWWAYMELGWGGYWAWDPVENASLIPWLLATATLHTLIVQDRRGKLPRANVCLMALTTVSAFFATFLVRSGIVQSVHAFGETSVGVPLLVLVALGLVISFVVPFGRPVTAKPLAEPASREGLLSVSAWLFLTLALIILTATMWPVISTLWSSAPRGLDANFYNTVCLPLGTLLVVFMTVCPWLGWQGGFAKSAGVAKWVVLSVFVLALVILAVLGYTKPVALVTMAAALAIVVGVALIVVRARISFAQSGPLWGAMGAHLGLALMALGIAFSGPYSLDEDLLLETGQTKEVAGYSVTLDTLEFENRPGYEALVGTLYVSKDGQRLGVLKPERRIYEKFGTMQFSEVDTIASLGNELYASLLGLDGPKKGVVKFSVKPLVNWIWVGGVLICLVPLLGLRRRKSQPQAVADCEDSGNGENSGS